ncbi:hypothetical protein K504DRAFT_456324 [Pleomassaria siparia CBS 279.74]|uniref:Uncharacterized protein n=1 Tax=Pleomassaria siparia CBS 279.74 TaxID=1314801 RepID=A0A6G1K6Z4_9PLEO|nr:hypothetical protein K504DRAFT_456324 [Pleomassaria siparia CBS 279.74]
MPLTALNGTASALQIVLEDILFNLLTTAATARTRLHTMHQNPRATTMDAAAWVLQNPRRARAFVTNCAMPVAGAAFAGNLMAVLPLGGLGGTAALLIANIAKFRLRQVSVGTFYALLHSARLHTVWGQIFSLLGFMSIGTLGPLGSTVQAQLTSLLLSSGGIQSPLLGLSLSLFSRVLGFAGVVPTILLRASCTTLYSEMCSYVVFQSLGWGVRVAEHQWRKLGSERGGGKCLRNVGYGKAETAAEQQAVRVTEVAKERKSKSKGWGVVAKKGLTGVAKGAAKMMGWKKKKVSNYQYEQTGGRVAGQLEWEMLHGERIKSWTVDEWGGTNGVGRLIGDRVDCPGAFPMDDEDEYEQDTVGVLFGDRVH